MARRIAAMLLRYFYLHRRSLPRIMEIFFWPLMNLFVWGFLTLYMRQVARPGVVSFLLGSMIYWEVLYRAQQSVSLSITEEFWVRNIINLFIAPLRSSEIVISACAVGIVKSVVTTVFLLVLARSFYGFDMLRMGWTFPAFYGALLLFGWSVGLMTMGLIFRYGRASEALIWGIPFLLQPLSAVFYPVSVLPPSLRALSSIFPSTYVFEGMRQALQTGTVNLSSLTWAWLLCLPWLVAGGIYFGSTISYVRKAGRLSRQILE
ncbi:putative ABC transporter ATP-binding and permease [Desulfovibrio sp. X2]|uniref:ABC transporter permease n=1 Tax=Desulfovibrio sp. X2 TaxID=941449 RepID=UPI000358CD80|nr:ABC transporter permease [Desulfovibrio sp. X2]EPR44501.1 putative ABC transporter ATP-binding and permease [Desulfovibrio sp. X2]